MTTLIIPSEDLAWYAGDSSVKGTSGDDAWTRQQNFCKAKGRDLCKYPNICPRGYGIGGYFFVLLVPRGIALSVASQASIDTRVDARKAGRGRLVHVAVPQARSPGTG